MADVPGAARRRRGCFPVAAVLLISAGIMLWFLPMLAARSSLPATLVKQAIPWFDGDVAIGETSLGWLSPVRIKDVAIRDEQGNPLAEIEQAATTKSFLSLLLDSRSVGEIQLTSPVVHVVVRPGGSNLEDALAPFFELESNDASVACIVRIVGGKCFLRDESLESDVVFEQLQVAISLPGDAAQPHQFQMSARVKEGQSAGDVSAVGQWRQSENVWGAGELNCQTRDAPLAALKPILTRCDIEAEISGVLNSRCQVLLEETGRSTLEMEEVSLEQLDLRAPQYIGHDQMRLARLDLSGEAEMTATAVAFRDVHLACDAGRLKMSCSAPHSAMSQSRLISALREVYFDADGEIDLAQLSQIVPHTLHLRDGLTITSGVVRLACVTKGEPGARRWEGRLDSSRLAAEHHGRPLTWERPISATFAIRDAETGPVIEQLSCESDFFRAVGRGAAAEGSLSLEGDLSRLAAELDRFVDLGPMQFGGAVEGDLQWRPAQQSEVTTTEGNIRLTNFEWAAPGRRPWREPQLVVEFSANAVIDSSGIHRLDRAQAELAAGGDAALVRLTAPVGDVSAATVWPVHLEARGELASWLPRVENLASLPAGAVEGRFSVAASGAVSTAYTEVKSFSVAVDSLSWQGAGMLIREPRVEAQGDLTWDGAAKTISVKEAAAASSTLSFRAENVDLKLGPAPTASGKIDYRADLQRLSAWLQTPSAGHKVQLAGMATGQVEAKLTGSAVDQTDDRMEDALIETDPRPHRAIQTVHLRGGSDVQNFACSYPAPVAVTQTTSPVASATASSVIWEEPRLRLAYELAFSPQADSLAVERVSVAGAALSLAAKGTIAEVSTNYRVDLAGEHNYDLAKLAPQLQAWLGSEIKMAGRGRRPFTFRGPLRQTASGESSSVGVPRELTGKTSVAWNSVAYNGMVVGGGEAAIELKDGVASMGPLDLPVSNGRLTLTPRLPLNNSPLALTLDAGPVLQNVRITPEMCRSWLKYVAPLVADATQAEGRFSVELAQPARIPLHDPTLGDLRGELKVHAAQVGPGPLSRQFLALSDQIKAAIERKPPTPELSSSQAWLQIPEQSIAFEAAGGRVYHRDLTVAAKDVVIRTRGSVGLDQSLQLLAEVPVQDRWIEREPLLAGFKGQSLQIPVTGTLTSPRLDKGGLDQLAGQMLGGAARRLLEENLKPPPEIKDALDRLFRRN